MNRTRLIARAARLLTPRTALLASLAIVWLNFLLTWRWAHVPGSIHGAREPWFLAALTAATLAALRPAAPLRGAGRPAEGRTNSAEIQRAAAGALRARPPDPCRDAVTLGRWPGVLGALAFAWLVVCFLVWFPPDTWRQIPLLDNWPARYQSTLDAIELLKRGAVVGWQWDFLGGYHTSSDLTVTLSAVAWPWIAAFGPAVGFHLAHAALFLAVPALVYLDLRLDENASPPPSLLTPGEGGRHEAALAAAIACLTTANFSYFLLRSGDTNSLAGVVTAGLVLVASHACARGVRWASVCLVGGLGLVTYSHAGFFVYTALFLVLEAICHRDRARLRRAIVAIAAGFLIGLPLTWESWRYPELFRFNNVLYEADPAWPMGEVLRKIFYNIELLWLPSRWFNDFSGLVTVMLPIVAWTAWAERGRARFHAWGVLLTLLLLRLNIPQLGYAFLRPIHMLAFFAGPVLAVFVLRRTGSRLRAVTLLATIALYVQVLLRPVPHIGDVRDAAGPLVDAVAAADGALVLVENHYHRDMIADASLTSPPTPFAGNFEALLPRATGKRLYAGVWDGWQWSPWRGQLIANGAWDGRALERVPHDELLTELSKWGIRHLFVWSEPAARYFAGDERFREAPALGAWRHFTFAADDPRAIVTTQGEAAMLARDALGARIRWSGARRGDLAVVRTNYHPAWTAQAGGAPLPLRNHQGQLAFESPADGVVEVELTWPRRPLLIVLALMAFAAGTWLTARWTPGSP